MRRIEPAWPAPANILAFTTTRPQPDAALLQSLLPADGQLSWLRQVHGTLAVPAAARSTPPAADASYTSLPGIACVVRTADCLPVLVCARDGSEVAAIHAGWRGLAGGVIESTLAAMSTRPTHLMAWLGPAICRRHFEVGEEVLTSFQDSAPVAQSTSVRACFAATTCAVGSGVPKYHADLFALARMRLAGLGVGSVYGGDVCSFGDSGRFYSWRREKDTGRMLSVILIT